jgi:hypothetical protein
MKISLQESDNFKDKVERLIRKYYLTEGPVCREKFLIDLFRYAAEQSQNYIPIMETHGTGVNDTQLDFNMIMMSIISISWAVRMRKIKSDEGQCHVHKTNCNDTRRLHRNIYNQWIDLVEEALEALRSDPPSAI